MYVYPYTYIIENSFHHLIVKIRKSNKHSWFSRSGKSNHTLSFKKTHQLFLSIWKLLRETIIILVLPKLYCLNILCIIIKNHDV